MEKYLYFRTVTDTDADDGSDDSIYVPTKGITGLVPTSATALTIFFKSLLNQAGNGTDDENVISDSVILNCTAGKVKQVMKTIVGAINSNHLYNDGLIVVADDVTTNLANDTVSGQYLDAGITTCGAITVATVLS